MKTAGSSSVMNRPFLFVQTDRDKKPAQAQKMILRTCQI
jgi:hypothetical protein